MWAALRTAAARSGTRSSLAKTSVLQAQRRFNAIQPYLLNTPPTKITKLSNGLRIASEETAGEIATIGVFIDAGSALENEKNSGVAHYLEHMAFKGTGTRSREAIEVEVENLGASLNAYTSREHTVYHSKVFKGDVPKAVNLLADILQNSKFEDRYIELERGTILREAQEVSKDHGEVIFDYLHAAAFQGSGLGRTILGPSENIERIKRDDLVSFVKQHYTAPRIAVVGAGAVKHSDLVALAESAFGSLPAPKEAFYPNVVNPPFIGSMITNRDDTMDDVHLAIAFQGVGWAEPDYFTFMLIQTLLGAWDRTVGGGKNLASRLCETVALEGLGSQLAAFNTSYKATGLFGVYGVSDAEHVEDFVCEIMKEFNRVGTNVTANEVERAKQKLKASILMQLDGTTAQCEDIGRQLLTYGRRLSPAEVFLRIDAITPKDVMRVMKEHCEDADPVVAAIGPIASLPDYNQIRGWTYWNRL